MKDVCFLDIKSKKIYIFGEEFKGKLIYTGMIDDLFKFKFGPLPYRSLNLKFEIIKKKLFQEVATINYPNDYEFTRITEFKHIHPVNTDSTVILKEFPRHFKQNTEDIPFYPIFTKNNRELFYKYKEIAKKFNNLILIGRLAEYKYYDVIKKALDIFEEKIK